MRGAGKPRSPSPPVASGLGVGGLSIEGRSAPSHTASASKLPSRKPSGPPLAPKPQRSSNAPPPSDASSSMSSLDWSSASSSVDAHAAAPPLLALLQAAPLVFNNGESLQPIDLLDLKKERDAVLAALRRAGRRVQVACDYCTTTTLRSLLTDGMRLLHYSGHGFSYVDRSGLPGARLAFENGEGGTHALEVDKLTALVAAGAPEGRPPLDLVFVSACHCEGGGDAFVAAGVPHVVCVKREESLQDKAACVFAEAFYQALFSTKGRTVLDAFEIGKQAVANQPGILRAGDEASKFILLPEGGDHRVALCAALPPGPVVDVSPPPCAHNLPAFFPLQFVGRQLEWQQLVSAAARHEKRLLTLVGAPGAGKTSLALAAAWYLYERRAFSAGAFFVSVAGASSAAELARAIIAALYEAGVLTSGEEWAAADEAAALPTLLRKLGPCLLLVDNWELMQGAKADGGGGGSLLGGGAHALLESLLNKAPELRLLLTCTVPLTLPGVAQRQLPLAPMAPTEAARLFRALAPRPISRREVGCDEPAKLKAELHRLGALLVERHPGISHFSVLSSPEPVSAGGTPQPLRVQWLLPDLAAAAALHRDLSAAPNSLLQIEVPPLKASGRAAVWASLSLLKVLADHAAITSLHGNPKAISLAVTLLLTDSHETRPLSAVAQMVANPDAAFAALPGADGCAPILEQLAALRGRPPSPPKVEPSLSERSSASEAFSDSLGAGGGAPATPPPGAEAAKVVEGGGGAGARLPAALMLRSREWFWRDGAPEPKWIGAGSFGAVYEAEHAGQKVAVKKFFESTASSSGFQREAALLADLRHAHVVQLIKVGTRPQLCIVTELLPCSLHALLHHGGAHPRRESLLGRQAVDCVPTSRAG